MTTIKVICLDSVWPHDAPAQTQRIQNHNELKRDEWYIWYQQFTQDCSAERLKPWLVFHAVQHVHTPWSGASTLKRAVEIVEKQRERDKEIALYRFARTIAGMQPYPVEGADPGDVLNKLIATAKTLV